ncbi:hypothetical protein Tco_1454828 [Tanacetum coccineum]
MRLMRFVLQDLALVANSYNVPSYAPAYDKYNAPTPYNNLVPWYNQQKSHASQKSYAPQQSYASQQVPVTPTSHATPIVQQQTSVTSTTPKLELSIPTFQPTNDLIDNLNKAMMFLSKIFTIRCPPTNNQLRTSSKLGTQANVQDGTITAIRNYAGNAGRNAGNLTGNDVNVRAA